MGNSYTYSWPWTGIGPYKAANPDVQRGKTLWDLLQLLVVPAMLAWVAIWFNAEQSRVTQHIANDQLRASVLDMYMDRMSDLLLNHALAGQHNDPSNKARNTASIATLTALGRLDSDGSRKGIILQFLYRTTLVGERTHFGFSVYQQKKSGNNLVFTQIFYPNDRMAINYLSPGEISLDGDDLSGTILVRTILVGADFSGANLHAAQLVQDDLDGASLSRADLSGATLAGAHLRCVLSHNVAVIKVGDLQGMLQKENQHGVGESGKLFIVPGQVLNKEIEGGKGQHDQVCADLRGANLAGADLSGADLTGANVRQEQLNQAKSLHGTIMPTGIIHK